MPKEMLDELEVDIALYWEGKVQIKSLMRKYNATRDTIQYVQAYFIKQHKDRHQHSELKTIQERIKDQLEFERHQKEILESAVPEWRKKLDWNKLLQTKLFNNPKI